MVSNFVRSLIRTYVPLIVGMVAAFFTARGVELSADTQAGLVVGLTGLFSATYYLLVRLVAQKWPALEVLLGSSAQPVYAKRAGSRHVRDDVK